MLQRAADFDFNQTRVSVTPCRHAGASLAKGVLAGDCVVCPWHAARFNVNSGDIEDGPICDALHNFQTTVSGGQVYVDLPLKDGKVVVPRKRTPKMACRGTDDARHFVVVGGGPASAVAVETLRSEGFTGKITMVTKEPELPYDRTALSKSFTPTGDNEPQLIRSREFYDKLNVNLALGTTATGLDPTEHSVSLKGPSGEEETVMQYDKILVATGGDARAFVPKEGFSISGSTLRGIFVLRDAGDVRSITTALALGSPGKKVVVVGSSFIGMEAAAFLAKKTKSRNGTPAPVASVTVVGMETVPFERVLGTKIGGMIQQRAEAEGVRFYMQDVVNEFVPMEGDDSALGEVELRGGETLEADMVIIGAGIIPATGWLQNAAGVTIKEPRAGGGVQCDEFLCAHASGDVFVAGDVAHFPYAHATSDNTRNLRIEHYDVAMDHGRVAARNMLGRKVRYEVVPFFWTGLFNMKIRYAGHARTIDDVIIHGSLGDSTTKPAFTAYYVTGDVVSGAVTINDDPNAVACLELLRARAMPSAQELASSSSFDPVTYLAKQQS